MTEQGFEFRIDDDTVKYYKEENSHIIEFRHGAENKFFFNSKIYEIKFYINSVEFTKPSSYIEEPLHIKHDMKDDWVKLTIDKLKFDLEPTDWIKIMFMFDISNPREGKLDLLL